MSLLDRLSMMQPTMAPVDDQAPAAGIQPQQGTIWGALGDYFGNPNNMDRLAMGFNTMRLDPDRTLQAALGSRINQRDRRQAALDERQRLEQQQQQRGNRTAALFRESGMEGLANVIEADPTLSQPLLNAWLTMQMQGQSDAANRQNSLQDWFLKEQWKRENPMPMSPEDQVQMQSTQAQIANLMQQMEQRGQAMQADATEAAEAEQTAETRLADLRGLVEDIYRNQEGLETYSGYSGSLPTVRPEQKGYEAKINRLRSGLTIDKLQAFKGAMSEKEMATAAAAAQSIVEGGDLGHNQQELMRLYQTFGGDPAALTGATSGTPTVTTKAQYDALPSGAKFIEDGVEYIKP